MRTIRNTIWVAGALLLLAAARVNDVQAQVNTWTNETSGSAFKWETGGNWSAGAPSISQSFLYLTNSSTVSPNFRARVVNIDATTVGSFPSTMTISNLTVSAPGNGVINDFNTLYLTNAGTVTPLRILRNLSLSARGAIAITGSVLRVDGLNGGFLSDDGTVTLDTGTIITTNLTAYIGDGATGQFTVHSGTWLGSAAVVGSASGSSGVLAINGGSVTLSSSLEIGASGVGAIFLSGGQLNETNETYVGEDNLGQMTVSNGTWVAGNVYLGLLPASQGTVTIAGGTSTPMFGLEIGYGSGSTGSVWLTGGQLNATNETSIGWSGVGQMTVSNGTWAANNVYVGNQFSSLGTLTVAGGTNNLLSALQIAFESFTTGTVWMTGGQLTVTGATVVGENGAAQMTVSNGTWLTGAEDVGNGLGSSGTLTIAGGTNKLSSSLEIALSTGTHGALWLTGGLLSVTNQTIVGENGVAQMTVSNGTWTAGAVVMARSGSSSRGTLTIAGGTITASSLGISVSGTGTLWLTGGQLSVNAAQTIIGGGPGAGQMIVSNGTWMSQGFVAGNIGGGTLTIAGGASTMFYPSMVGETSGGTGTLWITGGLLDASGQELDVGIFRGIGRMTVSNGTFRSTYLSAGYSLGAGTITVAGGASSVFTSLTLGQPDCSATGVLNVVGGNLFVTNDNGNAVLDVENGTFTLSSGTVVVNTFVMTNACAHFVRTGGTLIYGSAVLNPNADADGDGIPNGYEQAHGLDPLNPADAKADNDGDGFSNLQEYLAGTDPNDSLSTPFRITAVAQQGNNIVLTWTTMGGSTSQVQSTSGAANGIFATNGFANLSGQMLIGGSGLVTTNYSDVGGATNSPAHYYRVRLVP